MKCGCNKDKDGIDTDVLKIIPQELFDIIGSKIGLSKGTKYSDEVKDSLKKDAENKGVRLREYLTENPLVSKQIIMIEKMKQGGALKFQNGKTLNVGYGNIYPPKQPLKKEVGYSEMTNPEKLIYMNRPAVKPLQTEDGFYDEENTTKKLLNSIFPANYEMERQELFLNKVAEERPDLAERITQGTFTDKDVNLIKLEFENYNKKQKKKFQFGGLMTRVDSTERIKDLNSDIQRTINPMLRDNSKVMQKGGQMNQEQMQQKFIQWLASKLGVKSQEELQAKVKQLGEAGIKKAQQQFMQEMQGQGGVMKAQQGEVMPPKGQFLPNNEYLIQTPQNAEYFKKNQMLANNPQMMNKMTALANRDYSLEMDRFKQNRSAGTSQQFQPEVEYQNSLRNSLANRYGVLIKKKGGLFNFVK